MDPALIDRIFAAFQAWREENLILEDGRKLGEVIAPFQRERFEAWDTKRRTYTETCTGSSKTTDMAGWVLSMLRFLDGWEAVIYARDKDQGARILDVANQFIRKNPDLRQAYGIEVQRNRILSKVTSGVCVVEASDEASAEGILADCIICEQLESWKKIGLWESIISRAHKRKMKVHVIANAPQSEDDWQWTVRDWAMSGEGDWQFLSTTAADVPWFTDQVLADAHRGLREAAFQRLYYNVVGCADTSLFTPEQVEAMCCLAGPADKVPEGIRRTVIALDLGLKRDLAVLTCIGERMDGSQDLLNMLAWQGSPEHPVNIEIVEAAIADFMRQYKASKFLYDQWQFERSAQMFRLQRLPIEPFVFTSKSVNDLANQLWRRGVDGMLRIYRGAGLSTRDATGEWDLAREMRSVKLTEDRLGYKIETKGSGTKDRVISLGMASLYLTQKRPIMPATMPLSEYLRRLEGKEEAE